MYLEVSAAAASPDDGGDEENDIDLIANGVVSAISGSAGGSSVVHSFLHAWKDDDGEGKCRDAIAVAEEEDLELTVCLCRPTGTRTAQREWLLYLL